MPCERALRAYERIVVFFGCNVCMSKMISRTCRVGVRIDRNRNLERLHRAWFSITRESWLIPCLVKRKTTFSLYSNDVVLFKLFFVRTLVLVVVSYPYVLKSSQYSTDNTFFFLDLSKSSN